MPRIRNGYSGSTRGLVTQNRNQADIVLTHEEALGLVRHLAEALTYQRGVKVEAHWGRRGGPEQRHLITVQTD